ncbi:spermidine family transporter [Schizosaccharomyces japonicus yFS275]|uniref:Spermidine family transporter n=1 Tax=Schizosaccharomyces japonicus (strain yFS275 / FY16936) TaxID=402676 RepID=B6JZL6_SCHJY|nr:spermidine family transporter [Schizosaccharomyces japonicus yFS275]EEB06984.1 spermidine family transporter [Schizosaccharomyces japonicus yFS275]
MSTSTPARTTGADGLNSSDVSSMISGKEGAIAEPSVIDEPGAIPYSVRKRAHLEDVLNRKYPTVPNPDDFYITLDGPDDPELATNWPLWLKLRNVFVMGCACLSAGWGSSVFSAALPQVMRKFNLSHEVALLSITLYVLGFASGPVIWAPMCELFGRRRPMTAAVFIFCIFHIAVATAKDVHTILICRFFCGFFGSSPITTVAGSFADMFTPQTRGLVIAVYSAIIFNGPLISPIVGGFIAKSYLGWRWVSYITAIMGFIAFFNMLIFHRETYTRTITERRAQQIRVYTNNWFVHTKTEEEPVDINYLVHKYFTLPLRLLVTEPMLLLVSTYTAFVYGILYGLLEAYPIVFGEARGWSQGVECLPYLAVFIGVCFGCASVALFQPYYFRQVQSRNGKPAPEARLPPMMIAAVLFPIGIFWFAWTGNSTSIHWIVPTLAGTLIGFGIITIFQQSLNFVVDCYAGCTASAVAANTILRSIAGAVFPLFTTQMYHGLGIGWAGSLIGFVAVGLIPIPFLFFHYGPKIRQMSRFCLHDF